LLLPKDRKLALATLRLYPPQKLIGKLLSWAVSLLIYLGIHRKLLTTIQLRVNSGSPLAEISDGATEAEFGVLLGNPLSRVRKALLVYKVGVDTQLMKCGSGLAADAVLREMRLLRSTTAEQIGYQAFIHGWQTDNWIAFSSEMLQTRPLGTGHDNQILSQLARWSSDGKLLPLQQHPQWQDLLHHVQGTGCYDYFARHNQQPILASLYHGDFAPWNVLRKTSGGLAIVDWEHARLNGIAGWDLLHFHVQRQQLVQHLSAQQILKRCRQLLSTSQVQGYLQLCGWCGLEEVLIGSYLIHSGYLLPEVDYPRTEILQHWKNQIIVGQA
jgi:hypothetical protein